MSDLKDEPTPLTEEPTPDSRLTERLLARATQSLGVIDVRRAERHYARIMDWLAARTPLVEHLRSRYGLTEGEGLKGLGLAFADAQGSDQSINLSASPDGFTSPAEQLFTFVAQVAADSAAAETKSRRIARRGVPTFSHANSETDSVAGARQERGEVVRQERGEVVKPALERAKPNQEQTRDSNAPSSVKEIPAATVEVPGARAASTPAEESIPSPTRRNVLSVEERETVSMAEQDKTLARGEESLTSAGELIPKRPARSARGSNVANDSTNANDANDANESGRAAKPNALRVAESSGASTLAPETPARAPFGARERKSAAGAFVESEEVATTLRRRGATEGAKRSASETAGVKTFVASGTQAASVSEETHLPLARAREIHAGDFGSESATLHAQSPLPLAASPVGVERNEATRRQNGSAHAVMQDSSGVAETFAPSRARAGADEINVERLTEQVSRHLARRLLVERERRGLGRK